MSDFPTLMKVKQVADILGIDTATVTRHCQSGRLDYIDLNHGEKKNADYRFTESMVRQYIDKGKNRGPKSKKVKPRFIN